MKCSKPRTSTVLIASATLRLAVVGVAVLAAAPVCAQDVAGGRGLILSTSVDTGADYSVNSRLGGRDAGDLRLELRPGFSLSGRGGRLSGAMNYSLGLIQRSRQGGGGSDGDVAHNLAAQLSVEAVERWIYVDASAAIERQVADPYGAQGVPASSLAQQSTSEVARAIVSPYVQGSIGQAVGYEVRLNADATNTRHSTQGDSGSWGASATMSSNIPGRLLGWALAASSQETDFRLGRKTRNDRWNASLSWIPDPDLTLAVRGGEETTNAESLVRERSANWGLGMSWRPSARTRFQVDSEDRYFGTAHRVTIEHRTQQLSFSLGSSRSDGAGPASQVQLTAYQQRDAQLAALIPDPVQRAQQVLQDLVQYGQSPDTVVFSSLVRTAVTVLERHDVSLSYAGRRLALSVQMYREKSQVIDTAQGARPDPVRRKGYSANAGYRLSPRSRASIDASWLTALPVGVEAGNCLRYVTASLEQMLQARSAASFGVRYTEFKSSTPYREAGVFARLNHRF